MPELRHLRYFVAVAEELNFSRAARRLHMAQPPLSAAIRQLEQELGVDLFVRTSREVTLTAAGDAFLPGARQTLDEAERAFATARRAGAGEVGRLNVAYSWSMRFETLRALGQAFRAERPDVELIAQELWNAQLTPALRAGTVDVGVSLCPELASDLSYEVIRSERLVVLVGLQHPRAADRPLPLAALAGESFVLFPREIAPRLHDAFLAVYRRAGFEPKLRRESFHTGWDLGVLAELPVVALAPASVASGLPGGVVAVPLEEQEALETCLVWRGDEPSPTVAAFVEVARGVYGARLSSGAR